MCRLVAVVLVLAAASPAAAQTVRFPIARDDGAPTPYAFRHAYPLVTLLYDTLTWRDEKGVPQPWLADTIRRNGRTVTVRLRTGARWHDGRPVTAHDVAFTYRYVTRRPHPRFTPQVRDIAGVRAVDRTTVRFRLRRPALGLLDQPFADVPILPRHLWSGQRTPRPVGSGPFVLAEHRRGRYVLTANRGYFMGEPRIDRLEILAVPRADRALAALRAGRLDAAPGEVAAPEIRTASGPSYAGSVLLFNLRRPPFDRIEPRRAVAQALDLERVAGDDAAPADRGYLSPDSPWALPRPAHRTDVDAARVAFAEQGVPALTVLAPRGSEVGRQVVLALRRAGARANLAERSEAQLGRSVGQDGALAGFALAIWPTPALASHDPAFLRTQFAAGSPLNYSGYASEAFDALADRIDAAGDDGARRRAVHAALQLLARDLPVVPLAYPQPTFAYRAGRYDGWRFIRGSGILDKRSFLPGARPAAAPPAVGDPVDAAAGDGPRTWPLGVAAGLLAAGVAAALLGRRRRRV